jgi:hypothetical protein
MIRKPPASWQRQKDGGAVRAVRTAAAVAKGSAEVARRGGHAVRGMVCYSFAAMWGFLALTSGIAGSLPSLLGIGAMAAFMVWLGKRAFAKARAT